MLSVTRVAARYLSAAPLDDYYSTPGVRGWGTPKTVGWGREKDPDFLAKATSYFESRKDSWAIIVQRDGGVFPVFPEVEAYVAATPKLRRSKIIVVASEAMDGDESAPEWVVIHDIIGHSISNQFERRELSGSKARAFHKALSPKYQISPDASDLEPDLYAAIFFHAEPKDWVQQAAALYSAEYYGTHRPSTEEIDDIRSVFQELYDHMLEDVARWTSGFKPGVPRKISTW
jgi:hypothetical protein